MPSAGSLWGRRGLCTELPETEDMEAVCPARGRVEEAQAGAKVQHSERIWWEQRPRSVAVLGEGDNSGKASKKR